MMKKNLFLYLAAAVSCLLSCSEQVDLHKGADGALISLRSSTLDASLSSRSPLAGGPSVTSPLTVLVPSAVAVNSASAGYVDGLHALGTMTFSGVNDGTPVSYDLASLGVDADVKSTFPVGNQVYLFELYPGDTDLWTLSNTSASMTFTGKEDVMVAPELLITASEVESNVYQQLAFSHLLTRLEVKLKAKTSDAITSTGSIKSIRLVADVSGSGKIKDRLTFIPAATTNTDAASFAESAALTSLPFYKASTTSGVTDYTDETYADQSYVLTTSAALQAYSMVAPVTADASNQSEYFLAIERGDGDVDYVGFDLLQSDNLTPFTGSTAGYSFSVVLTYSQEYIESIQAVVNGTIGSQDWNDGSTVTVDN